MPRCCSLLTLLLPLLSVPALGAAEFRSAWPAETNRPWVGPE